MEDKFLSLKHETTGYIHFREIKNSWPLNLKIKTAQTGHTSREEKMLLSCNNL